MRIPVTHQNNTIAAEGRQLSLGPHLDHDMGLPVPVVIRQKK
jgi:hypothetical protein